MKNQRGFQHYKKNKISIKKMIVMMVSLPLFLIVSHIDAGDVCIHEVWAPTDCKVQTFRVHGGLKFIVTASKRVQRFYLELSQEVPDMNGNFASSNNKKGSKSDVKMWTVDWPNLSPDKLYYYVISVIDKKGCESHTVGAHWTNVRSLHLHISKIHVYDDGDSGIKGKGECEFYAFAKGKQIIKYGDYKKSWVSSGETVNANVSGILKDIGPGGINLLILGRECDEASGSIVDQITTWDKAEKTVALDLNEWEKENPAVKDFEVRATSNVLDFKVYCMGTVYYNKGENRTDPDVSHLQPTKPVIAPKPTGDSDKVKENKLLKYYRPPPPVIDLPSGRRIWYDVPVQIHSVSETGKPPIVSLSVEFQRFVKSCGDSNNPSCWVSEILHPQAQNINADSVNATIVYDKFKHKGAWRMRVRAFPKTGIPSRWTAWRMFQVKE